MCLLACNEDKPKQSASAPASAEPIPTDLVYNAGLGDKGLAAATVVSDAGSADAAVATSTGSTAKLIDAGAEPKSLLLYTFAPKTRTVTASIKIAQSQGGQSAEQTMNIAFTATPKAKFGVKGDATVDLKFTKAELPLPQGAPPQAARAIDAAQKALVGVTGHFDATTHGDIDNLDFQNDQLPPAAAQLMQLTLGALQFLVVPLPNEPVGIGARWSKSDSKNVPDQGITTSTTITMTLTARDAQTATLKVDVKQSLTQQVNGQGVPKGSSIQHDSTGSYTIVVRFDGISQKVDGEMTATETDKIPGQPDQGGTTKVSQTLTSL